MSSVKQVSKNKKIVYNLLKDIVSSLRNGSIISLIIFISTFIVGILYNKFQFIKAMEAVRSTLLICGSFGILASSILIIGKKSEKKFEHIEEWREKFKILSYKIVIVLISFTILSWGCLLDYILLFNT